MPKSMTVLSVFVASPGDVVDERTLIESTITEFNQTWGNQHSVMLELLKWETHSLPSFGIDGQDVINRQIGDEYDIFLGIMWGRFGSPTNRAESGTEEEFNRAYARLMGGNSNVRIMFYFKNMGIPPSQIDPDQMKSVQLFKQKIAQEYGGLYHEFETPVQFQDKTRMHLSRVVQDWLENNLGQKESSGKIATSIQRSEFSQRPDNPLQNLDAVEVHDDDFEDEQFDLIATAIDSMNEVNVIVSNMAQLTTDLSDKFKERTDELLVEKTPRSATLVSNKVAEDLETFVAKMVNEVVSFNKHSIQGLEAFGRIAMLVEYDDDTTEEDIDIARQAMSGYVDAISFALISMKEFRNTIFNMPRMTSSFNRARKRTVAILDDLSVQLHIAQDQSYDIKELLDGFDTGGN